MAHVEKFARGTTGVMCGHYGRTEGDGVRRSNENIDPARTHLNYNPPMSFTASMEAMRTEEP